jgi:thioredoxin-related protein
MAGCSNSNINWFGYEEGAAIARQNNKHTVVYFSADSCSACTELEETVFQNKIIAETLEKDFVPIKINLHEVDSVYYDSTKIDVLSFRKICKVPMAPTWAVFNSEEEWLESFHGLKNAAETSVVLDFYKDEVYKETKLVDYLYYRYFNKLLEEDNTNAELQYLAGYFYYHAVEKYDIAEKYFLKAVNLNPKFAEAYAVLYKLTIKKENYNENLAEELIEKAKENGFSEFEAIVAKSYELAQKYGPPVWE